MKDTLKKFLTESLGMTAEQITALEPQSELFDSREAHVQSFFTRQQQLDADRQALTTAQAEWQTANDKLNLEISQWSQRMNDNKPITEKMVKDLADAQAELARTRTVATTLAQQAGVDINTVLPPASTTPVVPAAVTTPAVDLSGYVKRDDVNNVLGETTRFLLANQGVLMQIANEHHALTGEYLDTTVIVNELTTRASTPGNKKPVDARAIWEELHGIAAKRAEREATARAAEIAAAESRGYERARSDAALPIPSQPGTHSPVLTRPSIGTPKLTRPGVSTRISAAASALAQHRYRPQGPQRPANTNAA